MRRLAAVATLVVCFAACSSSDDGADPLPSTSTSVPITAPGEHAPETAVWSIAPGDELTSASSVFTAQVSRLGCSGGVTGPVRPPSIEKVANRIVVTFTVQPVGPGGHTCPGNDQVPTRVDLGEPIRDRQLVDGACRAGKEAASTSFCIDGAVRWPQPNAG